MVNCRSSRNRLPLPAARTSATLHVIRARNIRPRLQNSPAEIATVAFEKVPARDPAERRRQAAHRQQQQPAIGYQQIARVLRRAEAFLHDVLLDDFCRDSPLGLVPQRAFQARSDEHRIVRRRLPGHGDIDDPPCRRRRRDGPGSRPAGRAWLCSSANLLIARPRAERGETEARAVGARPPAPTCRRS